MLAGHRADPRADPDDPGDPSLREPKPHTQRQWRLGQTRILNWLENHPGQNWQERWIATGAQGHGAAWKQLPNQYLTDRGLKLWGERGDITLAPALLQLICLDVIRPDGIWLLLHAGFQNLSREMARLRDPDGFAALNKICEAESINRANQVRSLRRIAAITGEKGGLVRDITVGDCLQLGCAAYDLDHGRGAGFAFYQLLHAVGIFPEHAPPTVRMFTSHGQRTPEQLIDRHGISCGPIRDLLVDYLRELQTSRDYATLRHISDALGRLFWRDLELHHPGIASLHLPPEVVAAWKQRVLTKTTTSLTPTGEVVEAQTPRKAAAGILFTVRAFYLDLAQWAAEDPARWGPWVAPCPIRERDVPHAKEASRRKARMDQRTRERLPVLPLLVAHVDRQRRDTAERLRVAQATAPGEVFTAAAQTLRRAVMGNRATRIWAEDPETGARGDLILEEHRGFWTWAAVEVLRLTGIRVEELTELSHHSFIQYRLPTTGELVPLLQIAPSKTDTERLLVISPELADVLSMIITRVRGADGLVPVIASYDPNDQVWNPPMPLLFQRRLRMECRPIPAEAIRNLLKLAVTNAGLTDATGQPLTYQPHDFRRLFVTDAVMNGMPPHIAQLICGHKDINTTMNYKTVYPEEVINGHRAFIARRRALRPTEEYRQPTDDEWEEFLGHFERRKVALGTCGRAYSTPCIHEHSCLRCPLLRPEPGQRNRLMEIHANLLARIDEAQHQGWLGEVEGLKASLAGAEQKLAQVDERARRTTANLGIPAIGEIAGRTAARPKPH